MAKQIKVREDNYFAVQGWMVTELKLKGNALMLYAIIYGFSQTTNTAFTGSVDYLCEWLGGVSRPTVINTLDNLVKQGLLTKSSTTKGALIYNSYTALRPSKKILSDEDPTSKKTLPDTSKNFLLNKDSKDNIEKSISKEMEGKAPKKRSYSTILEDPVNKFVKEALSKFIQYCRGKNYTPKVTTVEKFASKELNDAGYRNTVGKPWKPMDIPKFVYDCKNVGTMIINKERHDFESKQTIKLPKEEWVYVENALPPIVTQEEWDLICKIHEERVIATGSDRRGKKTSGYSFSGKLVCGICGAPYWRKQRVSKDEYWVCSTKQTKGRRTRKRDSTMGKAGEINPLGCDNENISYNSLMEIMGVVSERLQANTDTIKQDMINWLTKLRKQLIEANGGHTEADLQRELSRKSKLLDAYLDGILNKQEYQTKAEELDERIIQLKAETEKNKDNSGDIAEIDKVLVNIDEEVSRYVDGNEKLKVEYLLEHLEQVQIFPDKVIVIVPILSEGIVVEKTQYVSREKRCGKNNDAAHYFRAFKERRRQSVAGRRADDKKYSEAEKPDRLCA